jgi:hypothetical protein
MCRDIPPPVKPKLVEKPKPPQWISETYGVVQGFFMAWRRQGVNVSATITPFASIREIQELVCRRCGISRAEMVSPRRNSSLIRPRHMAIGLAKVLTNRSFPEIGNQFGRRDHTTILHAVRRVKPIIDDVFDAVESAPLPYLVDVALRSYDRLKPKGTSHARRG